MTDRTDGYAAAVVELARAEGELDRTERELLAISHAFGESPEMREALSDPRLPLDRKQSILDDLVGGRASQVTVNVLSLIVAQGRASDLPEIARQVSVKAAASEGAALAEVRSAVPLDDQTIERLSAALSKTMGTPVEVRAVVDPSVVGGIVARIGDTVIDGSVRRRLESLRETLQAR